MANTFANGLRIAAQKRMPVGRPGMPPKTIDPIRPQPVTDEPPALGLNPRPPTESGIPAPVAISGPSQRPVTPKPVRPPSLIQEALRRRRELEI